MVTETKPHTDYRTDPIIKLLQHKQSSIQLKWGKIKEIHITNKQTHLQHDIFGIIHCVKP